MREHKRFHLEGPDEFSCFRLFDSERVVPSYLDGYDLEEIMLALLKTKYFVSKKKPLFYRILKALEAATE